MGVPWSYGPKQFEVQAGQSSLIELKMPYRGRLSNFNLLSEGSGGTFELYDSENAARNAVNAANGSSESSSSAGHPDDAIPYGGFQILAGELVDGSYRNNELDIPYVNRDGTPTNGVPKLWLRVTPDGSGPLKFVVALSIEMANLF